MSDLAGEDVEGEAVAFESESALRVVFVEVAVVVVDISLGVVGVLGVVRGVYSFSLDPPMRSHVVVRVTDEPVLDAMEV